MVAAPRDLIGIISDACRNAGTAAGIRSPFRADAERERIPLSEVVARRLREAELLRRIFAYFPVTETRQMRSLVRKRESGTLSETESETLTHLAHQREVRNAQRLMDLAELSQLRGIPLRRLMDELNIRPYRNHSPAIQSAKTHLA